MQIDFHHAVTYVVARLAGFEHKPAEIVAYACQYVDDATSSGPIYFHNKAIYNRISSAHKMLDSRNMKSVSNQQVWLPFHFLPGNNGLSAEQPHDGKFIDKIICTPNSQVAKEMIRQVIVERRKPYGLHRLGVAMHVYADTWSHQNFAGVLHEVNEVEDAKTCKKGPDDGCEKDLFSDILDDAIPPLGHGRARILPDLPFLNWQYKNHKNELIKRNNNDLFCQAANEMCRAMQRFIAGDITHKTEGLKNDQLNLISDLLAEIKDKDSHNRHEIWLKEIADNRFSFGAENLSYHERGVNSWKHHALETSHELHVHTYRNDFLTSNWKLFHDAIQAHRFYIVHDLLPKYGICAA